MGQTLEGIDGMRMSCRNQDQGPFICFQKDQIKGHESHGARGSTPVWLFLLRLSFQSQTLEATVNTTVSAVKKVNRAMENDIGREVRGFHPPPPKKTIE